MLLSVSLCSYIGETVVDAEKGTYLSVSSASLKTALIKANKTRKERNVMFVRKLHTSSEKCVKTWA